MNFAEAKRYVLLFGAHKGKSLSAVAESDKGLLYLDWLVGQSWLRENTKAALEAFLADPATAREVKRAMEEKRR